MLNILATTSVANPKQAAIEAAAPNVAFSPFPGLELLTIGFFAASAFMIWLMIRAGKGHDYNS